MTSTLLLPDRTDALLERRTALAMDVMRGLMQQPKELPPKWLYDERGSQLFDEITRLPEYYPTRRERAILRARADAIAAAAGADTLVELGSGTSEKTRILLGALGQAGLLRRYVPLDVSEETLLDAADAIAAEFPGTLVQPVVGDFERDLHRLPRGGRRLVAFLGGTYGNLYPGARIGFLETLRDALEPGDSLLLGTDLVKDAGRLERAYDDAAGVTAAFTLNVLEVVNRELRADFDLERFEHVARWNADDEWVELSLRSTCDQTVAIADLGVDVRFAAGEELRTEISAKFRPERVSFELAAGGFEPAGWWTDPRGDYALSLAIAH